MGGLKAAPGFALRWFSAVAIAFPEMGGLKEEYKWIYGCLGD
jgi:hypothetical protein